MRYVIVLALISSVAAAQEGGVRVPGAEYLLRVRSADTTRQASMTIAMNGAIFGSLGATKSAIGTVELKGARGVGAGTVVGSLLPRPGRLTFSSSDPLELVISSADGSATTLLTARGKTVSVVYSDSGHVYVEATSPRRGI